MSDQAAPQESLRLHFDARDGSMNLPEIGLRGTGLHPFTTSECVDFVLDELDAERGGWLLASDQDQLRRVLKDLEFKELYNSATLRVASGVTLAWCCKLQRTPLPGCVQLGHLLSDLTKEASLAKRRIFLISETGEVAEAAETRLRARLDDVDIVGSCSITQEGANADLLEFARIGRAILKADPELILVGLDSPFQERLIGFLRRDRPNSWWIGLGPELKRMALGKKPAPAWMQRMGIDWLGRLGVEPGPTLKRHVLHGFPMAVAMLGRSMLRGMVPKGKKATRYGRRRPRALLVDDDPHALAHLELLLGTRFPQLDIHTRTEPDVGGDYEFYFIDNDFEGVRLASQLAASVREARPSCMIFAFSGALDLDTLKELINVGCDGVCDKADPKSWKVILDTIEERLQQMVEQQAGDGNAFGGIRGSALSIQNLLRQWNQNGSSRDIQVADPQGEKKSG